MRSWMAARSASLRRPRPTADWFVTTTTGAPMRLISRRPSSASGRNSNSAQDLTWSGRRRLITPSRSRKTAASVIQKAIPDGGGDRVLEHEMAVLDDAVVVVLNVNADVYLMPEPAAVAADEPDRDGPSLACGVDSLQHVGRVAARADGNHEIPGIHQAADRLGEDVVVRGVVRPGGQERDVVGERRDPQPRPAFDDGGLRQVAGEVGCRGGAAAVAEEVDVPVLAVGGADGVDDSGHVGHRDAAERSSDRLDVLFEHGCLRRSSDQLAGTLSKRRRARAPTYRPAARRPRRRTASAGRPKRSVSASSSPRPMATSPDRVMAARAV